MYKYVKFDENSGLCTEVGTGTNTEFYKSIGMVRKDVEQSEVDGQWYLTSKCPHYTDEEKLEKVKAAKLAELSAYAGKFDQYKCDEMYVTSSIGGYKFNADIRSQTNMQGLIDVLDEGTTTLYKDYDNEFRTITKADLAVLKSECLQNGQYLYQQKWTLQTKINACTSKEELDAIEIKFEMLEFNHAD